MTMQEKYEKVEGKCFPFTRENYEFLLKHFEDAGWDYDRFGYLKSPKGYLFIDRLYQVHGASRSRESNATLENPRKYLATLIDPRSLR